MFASCLLIGQLYMYVPVRRDEKIAELGQKD